MSFEALFTGLIITIAFFCESIFGFGGGLISIPLLSIPLGVKDAVTLVLIFQLFMGILIFKTHRHINCKIILPMTIGLVIGTLVGIYILSALSDTFLRRFLAISIFGFLIKMIFFNGFTFGKHKEKQWGIVAGLVGGLFQGIIGTGGPIFTMYLSVAVPDKQAFRASLIYLFFATSVVRILGSFSTNLLTDNVISLALPIIPFFLLAIFFGQYIHTKIPDRYYHYAIRIILFFAAVSMLLKG